MIVNIMTINMKMHKHNINRDNSINNKDKC